MGDKSAVGTTRARAAALVGKPTSKSQSKSKSAENVLRLLGINTEGWIEGDDRTPEQKKQAEIDRQKSDAQKKRDLDVKNYILAIWQKIYENSGDYKTALATLKDIMGNNSSVDLPSRWTPDLKTPPKTTFRLEKTQSLFVLKAYNDKNKEIIHYTIPDNDKANTHFTKDGKYDFVDYHQFHVSKGGRRTRRATGRMYRKRVDRLSTRRVR